MDITFVWIVAVLAVLAGAAIIIEGRRRQSDVVPWLAFLASIVALTYSAYFSYRSDVANESQLTISTTTLNAETAPALVLDCELPAAVGRADALVTIEPNHPPAIFTTGTVMPFGKPFERCMLTNYGRLPALNVQMDFLYRFAYVKSGPVFVFPTIYGPKVAHVRIGGVGSYQTKEIWFANNGCVPKVFPQVQLSIYDPSHARISTPLDQDIPTKLWGESKSFTLPPANLKLARTVSELTCM